MSLVDKELGYWRRLEGVAIFQPSAAAIAAGSSPPSDAGFRTAVDSRFQET